VGAETPATLAARLPAALACLLAAACGSPPSAGGPALPVTGRTPGGAAYRVTVGATVDPGGAPAWCPRVDLRPVGGAPTHGAVGCREVRSHVPTGGFAMFCRSTDVFVLLLSSPATRSVTVAAPGGRAVALTAYRAAVAGARFWLARYSGRSSPRAVVSVDGAGRHLQRYAPLACLDATPVNGLLGR
jgi:hypothetical protein